MKTAIYIEDGVVQLVITPQTDFEKNALSSFKESGYSTEIMKGSFYDCRGGWTRQNPIYQECGPYDLRGCGSANDNSLILRMEKSNE